MFSYLYYPIRAFNIRTLIEKGKIVSDCCDATNGWISVAGQGYRRTLRRCIFPANAAALQCNMTSQEVRKAGTAMLMSAYTRYSLPLPVSGFA